MTGDLGEATGRAAWVLLGGRAGDNAQAQALAALSGCVVRDFHVTYNPLYAVPNVVLGSSRISVRDCQPADPEPPWPDLVIGVGRRSVPLARWIRRRSGGRSRLVQIGRPRAPLHWFDLIITTPQYALPAAANVLQMALPFTGQPDTPPDVSEWQSAFSHLPRPWISVLVGGSRHPYVFDRDAAAKLAKDASELANRLGGSLLVSTSPRTGGVQVDAIRQALAAPAYLYAFERGGANPHGSILALADRFVVTNESASLIAEAVARHKPVSLFDVPCVRRGPIWSGTSGAGAWLARQGVLSPPRDMTAVCSRLLDDGLVHWLGDESAHNSVPSSHDAERLAERLRSLLMRTPV